MTYPTPDYRLNPPDPTCAQCHRPARPHEYTCSPDCEAKQRERDAMHDARYLMKTAWDIATDPHGDTDPLKALSWLWFRYRSNPDAYETIVRDLAIDLITPELELAERDVWTILRTDKSVTSYAQALSVHHQYAAAHRESVRAMERAA